MMLDSSGGNFAEINKFFGLTRKLCDPPQLGYLLIMTTPIDSWIATIIGLGIALLLLIVVWIIRYFLEPVVYIEAVESLLTPTEQKFYEALDSAIDGRLVILAKVRVADLLNLSSKSQSARYRLFMSIACKHIDFVLAEVEDLHPVAAVELDDSSHQRADRRKRDELLNNLFERAELPLLRFPTSTLYNPRKIEERVWEVIGP